MSEETKQKKPKPMRTITHGVPVPKKIPPTQAWLPVLWVQRALAVTSIAAATDLTRPHLCAISLEVDGKYLIARANDGHWLIEHKLMLPDNLGTSSPEPLVIAMPLASAKRLLRDLDEIIKDVNPLWAYQSVEMGLRYESEPPRRGGWERTVVHPPCVAFDLKRGVYSHALGTGKIPKLGSDDYESIASVNKASPRIIRSAWDDAQKKGDGPVGINGHFLSLASTAIQKFSKVPRDRVEMKVTIGNPQSPFIVQPARVKVCEELTIVIMPMRVS